MSITRLSTLTAACLLLTACSTTSQHQSARSAAGEALWDQLEPASGGQKVPAVEANLGQLFDEPLSPETCQAHRAAIEHYLGRIPVDLSNWQTARECARLLEDTEWAARSTTAIDQLVSYATNQARGQDPWNPAPVLHAWDIFALSEERGKGVKWMRYLSLDSVRHFLIEASVVDGQGRERREYFDLLDGMLRLNSGDPALKYPGPRRAMMFSQLEADVFDGDPLALTGYLYIDLESGDVSPVAARRALQRAWESGLPGGGVTLGELCLGLAEANCEPELINEVVDSLIEVDVAEGWALKAASVLMSNGFDLDDAAVENAIEQAGRLSAPDRMLFYLADLVTGEGIEPGSPQSLAAETLLERAAELGHGSASLRLAMPLLSSADEAKQARGERLLDQAVDAGVPFALHAKGIWEGFATAEGIALIRRAAAMNVPHSQFLMGLAVAAGSPDDGGRTVVEWYRQAALGGHVDSMRMLAQRYLTGGAGEVDIKEAEAWLFSGWMFDDVESAAWLAALYVIHPELNPELDDPGLEITLGLYEDFGAEVALMVSDVLTDVEPFNEHPSKAIALLKNLSAEGIAEASVDLGERFRFGHGVSVDPVAAQEWFELGFEQGSAEGMYALARMQLGDLDAPDDAVDSYAIAIEQEHEWASNDLAYMLCTGEAHVRRDPERGLRIITELFERKEDPHHYQYSTLAACQAATGEFEQALVNHRRALEQTKLMEPEATDIHDQMRARMALYQEGRPYIWDSSEG